MKYILLYDDNGDHLTCEKLWCRSWLL